MFQFHNILYEITVISISLCECVCLCFWIPMFLLASKTLFFEIVYVYIVVIFVLIFLCYSPHAVETNRHWVKLSLIELMHDYKTMYVWVWVVLCRVHWREKKRLFSWWDCIHCFIITAMCLAFAVRQAGTKWNENKLWCCCALFACSELSVSGHSRIDWGFLVWRFQLVAHSYSSQNVCCSPECKTRIFFETTKLQKKTAKIRKERKKYVGRLPKHLMNPRK